MLKKSKVCNVCGRFAAPSQAALLVIACSLFQGTAVHFCRCCATFAAAASRRLRNVSRHRSLFVGHCCSLFAVATQRFKPSQRFSSSSIICRTLLFIVCRAAQRLKPSQRFSSSFIICRTLLFIVCRCCATFEASAAFLVIVHYFQDTVVHCLLRSCFNIHRRTLGRNRNADTKNAKL